jgi:Bacterial protein of unknown function (HtrL_YibB)
VQTRLADLYDSLRPVRATDAAVNPDATIVTAYVEISDVPPDTEASFVRRSPARYLDWMRSVLSIRQNMVIFVEASNRDFVADARKALLPHTVIETVDSEALRRSPRYRDIKRIIDAGYMQHATRPQRIELKAPLYAAIMFSKFDWMRAAVDSNPFGTRYFLWMDAGYGHGLDRRFRYRSVVNRVWPSAGKNYRMEDTVLVLGTGLHLQHLTLPEMMMTHNTVLAGGIWGGDREKLLIVCQRFQEELSWTLEHNLLDDEQSVMSAVYMKYPELFTTVDCSSRLRDRCYFLKYLDGSGP